MLIFEEVNNLNDLEFSIYKYIVNHPQEVLNMKIRDLAKETHVSTTSILRFCKKVNCDGYSELKTKIKILLNTNVNYEFDPRKMAAIDFFQEQDIGELNKEIKQCSKLILDSSLVVFFGIGSSGILAEYAARSISSSGKICYFIKDPFYPIFTQEISNTLLIVFSVSGNTEEALQFVLNFKSPNNLLISITNGKDNKLAKLSDYNLSYNMPSVVNEGYYLNLTSQIPVLYIIEAMMKEVAELIKK